MCSMIAASSPPPVMSGDALDKARDGGALVLGQPRVAVRPHRAASVRTQVQACRLGNTRTVTPSARR